MYVCILTPTHWYIYAYEYVCVCLAKVYIDKNRSNLKTLPIYNYYEYNMLRYYVHVYSIPTRLLFLLELFLFLLCKLVWRKKYFICF